MEDKHFEKTPYRLMAKPSHARTREEPPISKAEKKPARWRTAAEIWQEMEEKKKA